MTAEERDAWAAIYRLYDEYAPALRQADDELAGMLFMAAGEKVAQLFNKSCTNSRLILVAGYDILSEVYKDAKKRHQELVDESARQNAPPGDQAAQIA